MRLEFCRTDGLAFSTLDERDWYTYLIHPGVDPCVAATEERSSVIRFVAIVKCYDQ
jgi:hypothetical protein